MHERFLSVCVGSIDHHLFSPSPSIIVFLLLLLLLLPRGEDDDYDSLLLALIIYILLSMLPFFFEETIVCMKNVRACKRPRHVERTKIAHFSMMRICDDFFFFNSFLKNSSDIKYSPAAVASA
jgi:hypothetical protein